MIDPAPIQNALTGEDKPALPWQRFFRQVADWIIGADRLRTWTPALASYTGAATVTGEYCVIGRLVSYQVTIIPASPVTTTTSTTVSLPILGGNGYAIGTAVEGVTDKGAVVQAGQVATLPAIGPTSNQIKISGNYFRGGA